MPPQVTTMGEFCVEQEKESLCSRKHRPKADAIQTRPDSPPTNFLHEAPGSKCKEDDKKL